MSIGLWSRGADKNLKLCIQVPRLDPDLLLTLAPPAYLTSSGHEDHQLSPPITTYLHCNLSLQHNDHGQITYYHTARSSFHHYNNINTIAIWWKRSPLIGQSKARGFLYPSQPIHTHNWHLVNTRIGQTKVCQLMPALLAALKIGMDRI